jgi:hypothetical protein
VLKRRHAVLGIAALAAIGVAAACDENIRSHVYAASQFEQSKGCLDNYGAVDVVDGDDTGNQCPPVCLMNGGVYYISTMCPPYPPLFIVTDGDGGAEAGVDPICTAALAAYTSVTFCNADGGVADAASGDGASEGGDDGATSEAGDEGGDDGAVNEGGDDGGDGGVDAPGDSPTDAPKG